MSYIIIGASSGLGRELAYKFGENKNNLFLVSRDKRDLTPIKNDLQEKYKISVEIVDFDFSKIEEIKSNLIPQIKKQEDLKGILFPVGLMHEKDNSDLNLEDLIKVYNANFVSIVFTVSELKKIIKNKEFSFVGFGSVSGLLGRDINTNYAAAKRSLESFFESLAFDNIQSSYNIHFYTLGYLQTNLAFGKNLKLPKGNVKSLANLVYKNKNQKNVKRFFPFYWSIIAAVLKLVPLKFILNIKKFLK